MIATVSAAIARPTGRHGGFPTGRPWVYAIPSPFLGSMPLDIPLPGHSRQLGLDPTIDGRLSLPGGQTTGGDTNPDCLIGVFFAESPRMAWSLAADFRRARICLLCTVFRLQKAGLRCQERSPFSPFTSVPDDGGKYTVGQENSALFSTPGRPLIHRRAQLLTPAAKSRCINRWIIW